MDWRSAFLLVLVLLVWSPTKGHTRTRSAKSVARMFLLTKEAKCRKSLSTSRLASLLGSDGIKPFTSYVHKRFFLMGNKARLSGVAYRKAARVKVRILLVYNGHWKVDDLLLFVRRRWFSTRRLLALKQKMDSWKQKRSTPTTRPVRRPASRPYK